MAQANPSIGCTVRQCRFHAKTQENCSLDKIMVGTHEKNPTMDQCTDCKSFQLER